MNKVDLERISYKVEMIKVKTEQGHADFVFKVIGPNGISFHLSDRYSSMNSFRSLLLKNVDDAVKSNDLPSFPKKKFMGG